MSLKPGIGNDFYKKYKSDFFPSDESPVPGLGVRKKVPRYYEKILAGTDPAMLEDIKARRQAFFEAHAQEFTTQRLMDRYQVALAKQSTKKRNL